MPNTLPVKRASSTGCVKKRRRSWETAYLAALRTTKSVREACEFSGVSRMVVSEWRNESERFAKEEIAAREDVTDTAEEALLTRGRDGWEEPVTWKGQIATGADGKPVTIRRYDTSALTAWLTANCPDKYDRSKRVQVSGQVNHAHIHVQAKDLATLPQEQLISMLSNASEQIVVQPTVE